MRYWWLYLIECEGGSLYTGIALDVDKRYAQHLAGKGAKYTRANPPIRLIGKQRFADRSSATRAELLFKRLTRQEKQRRIPEFESTGLLSKSGDPIRAESGSARRVAKSRKAS